MTMKNRTSDKTRTFEIIAAVVTGIGKFIFMDWLDWRFIYIVVACLFWSVYVYRRYRADPEILKNWGFSFHNFWDTLKIILPFGLISLLVFFILGYYLDSSVLNWHILPLLLLYPLWGTIQQFIIIGLVAGNLKDMQSPQFSNGLIVLLTASVFGIVHYPHYLLIAGTFVLAFVYTFVYFKQRNLYVLGIFHGWLGAFFYYLVLGRDPFVEVFFS